MYTLHPKFIALNPKNVIATYLHRIEPLRHCKSTMRLPFLINNHPVAFFGLPRTPKPLDPQTANAIREDTAICGELFLGWNLILNSASLPTELIIVKCLQLRSFARPNVACLNSSVAIRPANPAYELPMFIAHFDFWIPRPTDVYEAIRNCDTRGGRESWRSNEW